VGCDILAGCIYGDIVGVYNKQVVDVMFQRLSFKVETMKGLALIGSGKRSPENVMVRGEAAKWHSREWQKPLVVTYESCDSRKLGLMSTVFQFSLLLASLCPIQLSCH
jgi:hypothetical protein